MKELFYQVVTCSPIHSPHATLVTRQREGTPGVPVSARMQALPTCSVDPSQGPWLPCALWPEEGGGLL